MDRVKNCARSVFKVPLLLILYAFVCGSCKRDEALTLKTTQLDFEYSVLLEYQLSSLGLVDLTKLPEALKEEIESLKIVRYANIPSTFHQSQIVIIDVNRNDKFEYDSIDMIGLTSFDQKFRFETTNFLKSKQPIVIKVGDEKYEVEIKKDGRSIKLSKRDKETTPYDLTYPYELPKVAFKKITKNAELNRSNNKYTLIEFWGTWCKPCIQITPEVKALKIDFNNKLNIVGVDYRDNDLDRVKQFIRKYKMNWDHILADKTLLEEFGNPHFVPCGILFDREGKLIQFGIRPDEVRKFLETH